MIKVNNIFKSFKEVDVLKNITFNFEKGAIVGFLGPNGAGKSTLIKIMTGIMSPDKGTIYINNENIAENRKITKSNIGYIPEVPAGFNNLTVKEFLFFCGELRDLKKDKIKSELALIDQQFKIKDIFHKRMESLSKKLGLPQKLRDVNIPKEACKKMAKDAMKQTRLLVNNPREVTEKDALNIYESAW